MRKKYLREDFPSSNLIKALTLVHKLLQRRTGLRFYWSPYPEEIKTKEGKFQSIICFTSNKKVIRYNIPFSKMGKKVTTIDIFYNMLNFYYNKPADVSIDCSTVNIIQILELLEKCIVEKVEVPDVTEFAIIEENKKKSKNKIIIEDVIPKTKGERSKNISTLINQWLSDKKITDDLLINTRLSHLWDDFTYWYHELANTNIPLISELTFRNYIIDYLESKGLKNIFVRTVKVTKGNKQVVINTDNSSELAYQNVQHLKMNLNDVRNFMEDSIRGLMRGYMNSLVVCGKAGFGKTTAVIEIAKDEGKKIEIVNTIKNISHLYNIFYSNNDPNKVIVFDDCVEIFNKKYMGMVLAALDDRKERIINFPVEAGKNIKKFNPQLVFIGKVIILTNLPKAKLPKAYYSRTVPIEVQGSIQDTIDDIRVNLENVMPEIELKKKQEVLDFIEKIHKDILNIDFRTFKRCMIYYLTGSPNWKKHIYYLLAKV